MLSLPCRFSPEELAARWDDFTSPARFAGNDGEFDMLYTATRKGMRVKLLRKAAVAHSPFATVFCGEIVADARGSVLRGYFRKRVQDYIFLLLLEGLNSWMYLRAEQMGVLSTGLTTCCIAVLLLSVLLAIPLRSPRKRYTAFLKRITDEET